MDHTINPEDISEVLKQFDRQKQSDEYAAAGDKAREVVSSLSTDTPITVLIDMRQQLTDLNANIREQNDVSNQLSQHITKYIQEQQKLNEQRHQEMLAFLNKLSNTLGKSSIPSSPNISTQMQSLSVSELNDKYYYKGDQIKTSQSVIGCFLMHLDILVKKTLPLQEDSSDTSIMELKDWSSAVTILREVNSTSTPSSGVLALPKKSSDEAIQTLDVIASPVEGRTVVCTTAAMETLQLNCPTITRCVEEIRQRAMACPGIIGSSRLRNLSTLGFPYITKDKNLNVTNTSPKIVGSAVLRDTVKRMNAHQKKIYAELILAHGNKPMVAANTAVNCTVDFKKWKDNK